MPDFEYSIDDGVTWVFVASNEPQVVPSTPIQNVMVQPIGGSATSLPAWFLNDTFTSGTVKLATAHTGETGYTWLLSSISGGGTITVGTTGTVYNATAIAALIVSTAPVTSPNYTVDGVFRLRTNIATTTSAIVGRASSTDSEFYGMLYDNGVIQLVRAAAGGARTVIGSYSYTPALDTEFTMRLIMNGNQISGQLNGVTVIPPVTDSTITRAGRVGLRIFGGSSTPTTGPHISQISAALI